MENLLNDITLYVSEMQNNLQQHLSKLPESCTESDDSEEEVRVSKSSAEDFKLKMNRLLLATFIIFPFMAVNCTIIATAGYIASSPLVRNYLINTGLSSKIRQNADSLYDISGLRQASDQGTDVRKALMNDQELVEIKARAASLQKRRGDFPKNGSRSQQEDRNYSEKLFGVLNQMDKNTCISRLLCEIGANSRSYGEIGLKIHHYIQSVPPVTWNSATHPYVESFQAGLKDGKSICDNHYFACHYNLNKVIEFVWYFMNPKHR
ncbi:uncharacterized protein LOC129219108 [Uloborus diversus]|uniref:uncharacterized protein LOC129219108 n=1 Tax=Uloborus diversus TaxID=327109 RepID=UPI0024096D98|nr:uncharacterized protein LOC129219108 [Uloborus diversus]